jgi:hypothetical protein
MSSTWLKNENTGSSFTDLVREASLETDPTIPNQHSGELTDKGEKKNNYARHGLFIQPFDMQSEGLW